MQPMFPDCLPLQAVTNAAAILKTEGDYPKTE